MRCKWGPQNKLSRRWGSSRPGAGGRRGSGRHHKHSVTDIANFQRGTIVPNAFMAGPLDVHSVQSVSTLSLATCPFLNPQLSVPTCWCCDQHSSNNVRCSQIPSLPHTPGMRPTFTFIQPPAMYKLAPPCTPQPLNPSPPTCNCRPVVDVVLLHQQRDHVVREHVVQAVVDGQVRGGRLKQLARTLKRTQVRVLGGALSARGGSVGGKRACCDARATSLKGGSPWRWRCPEGVEGRRGRGDGRA